MVSCSSASLLLANITNRVSAKLDSDNYLLWRSQFEPLLYMHDPYGNFDGTDICPCQTTTDAAGKKITNPSYITWRKQGNMLVSWLKSTLSEKSSYLCCQSQIRL